MTATGFVGAGDKDSGEKFGKFLSQVKAIEEETEAKKEEAKKIKNQKY